MAARTPLSLVLPLLGNLKRMSLVEDSRWSWNADHEFTRTGHTHWSTIGRQIKSALTDVFASPNLESIHISGLAIHSPQVLLSLFSGATALKTLALSNIHFIETDNLSSSSESQRWHPQLMSLRISSKGGGDPLSVYFLNPQIDLSRLTTLTVTTNFQEWTNTAPVGALLSLESIEHVVTDCYNCLFPKSTFHSNRCTIRIRSSDIRYTMQETFRDCPPDSRAESIIFEGNVRLRWPATDLLLNLTVASALVNMRSLRAVKIRVDVLSFRDQQDRSWLEDMRSSLPCLTERGLLTVTRSDEDGDEHVWN
ncbi:hypothetical protein FB45DRAFT_1006834 [Roridomyces roridus]|uniref:Uncharacterized protein n=1 Tax=Roridomyces roridus TaxID=1738132 RepID=A0AAD7BG40_9AGAR|nr:hypothetical protein FB45DRAFT_1006834 [Roridomyces roridus]